jgi:hypothetical protein
MCQPRHAMTFQHGPELRGIVGVTLVMKQLQKTINKLLCSTLGCIFDLETVCWSVQSASPWCIYPQKGHWHSVVWVYSTVEAYKSCNLKVTHSRVFKTTLHWSWSSLGPWNPSIAIGVMLLHDLLGLAINDVISRGLDFRKVCSGCPPDWYSYLVWYQMTLKVTKCVLDTKASCMRLQYSSYTQYNE